MKLDLACGDNKKEGFTGVDIVPTESCDEVCNLDQYPWRHKPVGEMPSNLTACTEEDMYGHTWEDNSVDEIWANNYLEHVSDLISFWNECYRILKPDAKMTIIAPYWSSIRAWQDPTHKQGISENTFLYVDQGWLRKNHLEHYAIKANFEVKYTLFLEEPWAKKTDEEIMQVFNFNTQFAMRYLCNVVTDIKAEMVKR